MSTARRIGRAVPRMREAMSMGQIVMSWPRVVFGALLSLGLGAPALAQDKGTLRLGFNANSARNIAQLPYVTVQSKGFLARENIDIKMVPLMGTTNMVA